MKDQEAQPMLKDQEAKPMRDYRVFFMNIENITVRVSDFKINSAEFGKLDVTLFGEDGRTCGSIANVTGIIREDHILTS